MSLITRAKGKCKRIATAFFTFPLLLLRYGLYVISAHKLYSNSLHEFSQILLFSPRIRMIWGMTTLSERAYFQWYAQHIYHGLGAIVDLGCYLGSTTIPLAIGLAKNSSTGETPISLHAYDEFIWRAYMERNVIGTPLQGKIIVGESFLPEFNRRIAPWEKRIIVHAVDLSQASWEGEKIEFLLIDAMKSWALTNRIIQEFFPALMPGKSFVLHQDFAHWFTPWIHLTSYRFRNYFEFVYEIPESGSVVFKLCKSIPSQLLESTFSFSSFKEDEIEAAFSYSFSLISREKLPNVASAKVMIFLHLGLLKKARHELEQFRSQGLSFDSDLSIVEKRLSEQARNR